jgi:hypothetical protein
MRIETLASPNLVQNRSNPRNEGAGTLSKQRVALARARVGPPVSGGCAGGQADKLRAALP